MILSQLISRIRSTLKDYTNMIWVIIQRVVNITEIFNKINNKHVLHDSINFKLATFQLPIEVHKNSILMTKFVIH